MIRVEVLLCFTRASSLSLWPMDKIMSKRILITDKVHELLSDGLKKEGYDVHYHPKMPYEEVCAMIKDYDGVIINSKVICDQAFLDSASHLDFIGRLGSGLDIIDLPYAHAKNIEVISSPEGNANAVAEHALGMLLGLLHKLHKAHQDITSLQWNREPNRGEELAGKTIGIIGFGHTGPAFAKKLRGCNVNILVYDKYRKVEEEKQSFVTEVDLPKLLDTSDIVSIHLPLTHETTGLVNQQFFNKMKKGSIIINTSRGKILDSSALLSSLEDGHLSGACLDVLENEKPETWTKKESSVYRALINLNEVMITPHVAGWTHQSLELIASILRDKICKYYQD